MIAHCLHHQQTALCVTVCPECFQEVGYHGEGIYGCPTHGRIEYTVSGWRSVPCPFPHVQT